MESRIANTASRGALLLALAFVFAIPQAASALAASAARADKPMTVTFGPRAAGPPIPRTFLGLSFELASLPQIVRAGAGGNLVALLRSLGPGVLRFGGVSADTQVGWSDGQSSAPAWATRTIGPEDFSLLANLARASGWRVLLTIGLVHFEPEAAAREGRAAQAILGPSLAGIELGNEPNAYAAHNLRASPWTFSQYAAEASTYLQAIAAGGSLPPLAGPDVSGSPAFLSWGSGEALGLGPALLTGHHYPLGCHDAIPPSSARLLSQWVRRRERRSTRRYMSASAGTGIPFRLDEAGSVSCGGRAGVSDTFAASLWATDYIAHTMAAGMAGINFHGNLANCHGYSPLCAPTPQALVTDELQAQPEWYAMLLDRTLLGDVPLTSHIHNRRNANLDVVMTRAPGGALHALIVNDSAPGSLARAIRLRVGSGFGAATALALRAPSPEATGAITIDGISLPSDGTFAPPSSPPRIANRRGAITLRVAPSSAELLTIAPTRAARRRAPAHHARPLRRRHTEIRVAPVHRR